MEKIGKEPDNMNQENLTELHLTLHAFIQQEKNLEKITGKM